MVHVHVHVHNLHCTIIFMLILGQSHIHINMHTLPFLQAITVLNHAGVCVSYQTAWKYVQQLTTEARYQEAVHSGHWQWVFDNVNMHQRVRHEREGSYKTYTYLTRCLDKIHGLVQEHGMQQPSHTTWRLIFNACHYY